LSPQIRKPSWLKTRLPSGEVYRNIDRLLGSLRLNTVCSSARCPNLGDCWGRGTATFMILGNVCTRHCRFCAVKTGNPHAELDATEPERIAEAVARLKLRYVVLTSVDRDDLPDLGAGRFARAIQAIRDSRPGSDPSPHVEVLIPDLQARRELLALVIAAAPLVLGHNLETVEALTSTVRDHQASYARSLEVLRLAKELNPGQTTKSGIMLGLGETREQVIRTMRDLREVQVDVMTIGQYLRPSHANLPVVEYVPPEQFTDYARTGRELGFRAIFSAPLVRSSFHAEQFGLEPQITRALEGTRCGIVSPDSPESAKSPVREKTRCRD
jgi:lipoic acid synthetase